MNNTVTDTVTDSNRHTSNYWEPNFESVILCPNFSKNLNESMYSFGSNGCMNVGMMDTLMDIEYERGDSQVIIDNVIYDTVAHTQWHTVAPHSNRHSSTQ